MDKLTFLVSIAAIVLAAATGLTDYRNHRLATSFAIFGILLLSLSLYLALPILALKDIAQPTSNSEKNEEQRKRQSQTATTLARNSTPSTKAGADTGTRPRRDFTTYSAPPDGSQLCSPAFTGMWVRMRGMIERRSIQSNGAYMYLREDGSKSPAILVAFDLNWAAQVATLHPGDLVTISGQIKSQCTPNPVLEHGEIENPDDSP